MNRVIDRTVSSTENLTKMVSLTEYPDLSKPRAESGRKPGYHRIFGEVPSRPSSSLHRLRRTWSLQSEENPDPSEQRAESGHKPGYDQPVAVPPSRQSSFSDHLRTRRTSFFQITENPDPSSPRAEAGSKAGYYQPDAGVPSRPSSFSHNFHRTLYSQSSAQDPYHGQVRAGLDSGHRRETSYGVVQSVLNCHSSEAHGHGRSRQLQGTSFHQNMDETHILEPAKFHIEKLMIVNQNMDESYVPEPAKFPTGKLMITVVKARGVKGDEAFRFGKADVYGILTVGGTEVGITQAKTLVHDRAGSDPYWNQTFVFLITEPHRDFSNLRVELYNKNWRPGHDSPLGGFRNDDMVGGLRWKDNKVSEEWYTLYLKGKPGGEICLSFNFTHDY